MKIGNFAALIHVSSRTVMRMVDAGELSGTKKDIDYSKINVNFVDFLDGKFYTRETIKKKSGLGKYEFNKLFTSQIRNKTVAFSIGSRDFYYYQDGESIYSDFLNMIRKSKNKKVTALEENLKNKLGFSYKEILKILKNI